MRNLVGMTETRSSVGRFQAQTVHQWHHRKRAIILRTAPNEPVTATKSLQFFITIVIGCHAFLLAVPRLWRPECHAIGFKDGRKCQPMFLTSLAITAHRGRDGIVGTHESIEDCHVTLRLGVGNTLLHVGQNVVPTIVIARLSVRSHIQRAHLEEPYFALVVHEFHDHLLWIERHSGFIGIVIKHNLQIGRHGNDLVHFVCLLVGKVVRTQQSQQTIERSVVTEAQRCSQIALQSALGLGLNIVP